MELAWKVHAQHLVEIGPLYSLKQPAAALEEEQGYLIIEEIEGVEPLDSQASSWPMKDVPDALYEPLFGQIEPSSEAHTHVSHSQSITLIKTYAILDAAKTQFGLTEFRNCAMPFRCLFKGEAAEELKDKAPYLIELEARNDFTRTLFTHNTNMPDEMTTAHLWHKEPAIYIRSRADFDTLWRHFRKFTQIKDEKGKWYFFRFWEPGRVVELLQMFDEDRAREFLHPVVMLLVPSKPVLKVCVIKPNSSYQKTKSSHILRQSNLEQLSNLVLDNFSAKMVEKHTAARLLETAQLAGFSARQVVQAYADYFISLGFYDEESVDELIQMSLEWNYALENWQVQGTFPYQGSFNEKERIAWLKRVCAPDKKLIRVKL